MCLAIVLSACASTSMVEAQEPLPTFKASIEAVPISAVVRDRRGRIVTTLTAADFEVIDKGERRPILDFQIDQASPVTIAVLVDTSGSMRIGAKLAFARDVLNRLAADLHDGRDEVSLFTFDAGLHEQQPFTIHPAVLQGALDDADPFGVTSLYDAIAETARRLGTRPAQRRAVVVITDGLDTSSSLTPPEVSGLASSIDAPVYVVATVPPIDYAVQADRAISGAPRFSADLHDLAAWTGGDLLWVKAPDEAGIQVRQIVAELRHQYLISIEPAADQEWRPLDIRVRDRKMTVRARSGYFGSRPSASR